MKIIIAFLITLVVIQSLPSRFDFSEIPEEELKALEDSVSFKRNTADAQLNNAQSGGFLQNLFGGKDNENNKFQFSKIMDEVTKSASTEDKNGEPSGVTESYQKELSQIMKNLPYQALLPRRRNSSPLGLLGNLLNQGNNEKQSDDEESQENPLKQLDKLILNRQRKSKGKKLYWQNPDFKDGKTETPFMKIFGPKSKGRHGAHINEDDIQKLLVQSMPTLKDGRIIKLSQVPYRRGVYLNIEYQTVKGQTYTIKAKYARRTNELQIISLNQINVLKKEDASQDNDDEVEIQEKPVIQELVKLVEAKLPVQDMPTIKEPVKQSQEKIPIQKDVVSKEVVKQVKEELPVEEKPLIKEPVNQAQKQAPILQKEKANLSKDNGKDKVEPQVKLSNEAHQQIKDKQVTQKSTSTETKKQEAKQVKKTSQLQKDQPQSEQTQNSTQSTQEKSTNTIQKPAAIQKKQDDRSSKPIQSN